MMWRDELDKKRIMCHVSKASRGCQARTGVRVYAMTAFRKNSLTLNCLFVSVLPLVDLSYMSGDITSFLRLQGNTCIAIRMPDSRYSSLWSERAPNLNLEIYVRAFMKCAVRRADAQYIAPILYVHIQPRPPVVRQPYRCGMYLAEQV